MRTVFMDTVGLIALWDEADQWHVPANAAMGTLTRLPVRFVTSSPVFLECGNAAARKPYRTKVADLMQRFA